MSRHDSKQIGDVKVMLVKGDSGSSIASIEKTGTDVLVDTYTVTLTDGSKTTFTVTNGKGITQISKTGTEGLVDTYTITFNDGTSTTFDVANANGIESVEKTATNVLVDTYTITFEDGSTSTFTVTNGKGISSIEKTATAGLVDTYTITFNDNTTSTFNVGNGKGITTIEKTSTSGLVDTYTITFNDGTTQTFDVTNGANGEDVSQSNLAPVEIGNTASQSYAVGSHLVWNGIYYKVTQAIAIGGSFTENVNIERDTVSNSVDIPSEKFLFTLTPTSTTSTWQSFLSQIGQNNYSKLSSITKIGIRSKNDPIGKYNHIFQRATMGYFYYLRPNSNISSYGIETYHMLISSTYSNCAYGYITQKTSGMTYTDYKSDTVGSSVIDCFGIE